MSPLPKKQTKLSKDTIYIDIEDEITAVIDKLHRSESKVVAFVLPKRAATMQSIVNLKLLKRAAENVKKSIVLITSDSTVLPLAGMVGLHVAKTLQTKPTIPPVAKVNEEAITIDSEVDGVDAIDEPEIDPKTPIGKLTGEEETIELEDQAEKIEAKPTNPKKAKNRKLAVPNFDSFRIKLFLGLGLLLLLIGGWLILSVVLPKANIAIRTDTTQVNTSLALDAKGDVQSADLDKNIVPAYKKEVKKSSLEKVPTTAKRDDGTKASGTMTIYNCSPDVVTLPAGTIFTSGLSFVSDKDVSVPKSSYSFTPAGFVCDKNGSKTVSVTAQSGGASYNLSARGYQIQNGPTNVSATGSDMAGGTSKLISVVGQSDLDSAKQQALDKLSQAATSDLKTVFKADQAIGLEGSLENQSPTVTSNLDVGKEATEVEVTVNVTYTMYGVKRDILTQAIEKDVKKHIDSKKQTVQNTGLDQADIRVVDKPSSTLFKLSLQTTATAGPQLDTEGIKKDIAGKNRSQTQDAITARPGIKDVKISYSPFWVVSTPKQTKHITITFTEANAASK